MIQRIQSIFLFLASATGLSQLGLPYATGTAEPDSPVLADGVFNLFDNFALVGLGLLSAAVSMAAIFFYRNRVQQARITGGAALATLFLILLIGVFLSQIAGRPLTYQFGLALPVLALVFQWLAVRFIRKDEAKVKSMDRLR